MIDNVISEKDNLSDNQKSALINLCKKIYMIESSGDGSNQQLISDIKGEISLKADAFKD